MNRVLGVLTFCAVAMGPAGAQERDGGTPSPRLNQVDVGPAWRDAERAIESIFKPSPGLLGNGSRGRALIEQVAAARPVAPPGVEAPGKTLDEKTADQILACQVAGEQPARWLETEVEVFVEADGTVPGVHVRMPSGNAKLDEAAVAAVRTAFAARPVRDPRGALVAIVRVAAARVVQPPRLNPVLLPGSRRLGGLAPQVPFSFEETTGRVAPKVPFKERVLTRARVESLRLPER